MAKDMVVKISTLKCSQIRSTRWVRIQSWTLATDTWNDSIARIIISTVGTLSSSISHFNQCLAPNIYHKWAACLKWKLILWNLSIRMTSRSLSVSGSPITRNASLKAYSTGYKITVEWQASRHHKPPTLIHFSTVNEHFQTNSKISLSFLHKNSYN